VKLKRGEIVHNILVMLLTGLISAPTVVLASERPIGEPTAFSPASSLVMAAAAREATRLARHEGRTVRDQVGGSQRTGSGGHPVLIGAAIGAGVGAIVFASGSCSVDEANAQAIGIDRSRYCGTRTGWAVVGGAVGAGVGALLGLAFKH
jgi:hypothetical protein